MVSQESEIAELALENLQATSGIVGEWIESPSPEPDGIVILRQDDICFRFTAEVKGHVKSPHVLSFITSILTDEDCPPLLIARKLPRDMKRTLRERKINYLEANGNAFISVPGLFVFTDANKPLEGDQTKTNRAFSKAGIRLLFELLQDEQLLNASYREIAERTAISLGNVSRILSSLKEQGFLIALSKTESKLTNKQELLDRWISAYHENLKPTLAIGTFRFVAQDDFLDWRGLPLKNGQTWWGSEPGAALLTQYLQPEVLTLYTTETRAELMRNYRLLPDPEGNVKIFKKFWLNEALEALVAPPLLVYSDLINTNDSRCIETAQRIYHDYLQDYL